MKILVVDDDSLNRDLIAELLNTWGFSAVTAGGPLHAACMLKSNSFDVVITDQNMHGSETNGSALIEVAKAVLPNIKAILMSGEEEYAREAKRLGVKFLPKPFSVAELSRLLLG